MKTKNLFLSTAIAITALFISCNEPEQQPEVQPFLRVSTNTLSVPPEVSERNFVINSNVAWEVSISDDADWLTINQMQGDGIATIRVTIKANFTTEARNAVITVTSGALSANVTLTQADASPRLSTFPNFINANGMGNLPGGKVEHRLNVTSSVHWTAEVIDAELQQWISIEPTSGSGGGVITITLDPNMRFARRHAFISVSAEGIQQTSTVFQRAAQRLEPDQFTAVTINGITWATRNVNEFGTFVPFSEPHNPGKYFQFNRPTAYSVVDGNITPPLKYNDIDEDSDWTILNDPCPCGWRVPTRDEMESLRHSGFRWVNEPAGAWLGTDAQTATFETPGNTIFLPAGGRLSDGGLHLLGVEGNYWTRTQFPRFGGRYIAGYRLVFTQSSFLSDGMGKSFASPIRCVVE